MRGIAAVISEMEGALVALEAARDPRRYFHATYLRTTRAVARALEQERFCDPDWVERWDVAFAELYLSALRESEHGETPPAPWAVAFRAAREQPDLPPVRHLLLAVNAHVNFDLPQALIAVISDEEFADPTVARRRNLDHERIDGVLGAQVQDEEHVLVDLTGRLELLDRLLRPLNRMATRRFLRESREKVWSNALELAAARSRGEGELSLRVAQLEQLCAAKLGQLLLPGQVLLRLAVVGFGVRLGESHDVASAAGSSSAFRGFDPVHVGCRERDLWVAYCRHEWSRLALTSVLLVRVAFKMRWPATARGAWHLLRAIQLWAPAVRNDPEGARRQMRRFYTLLARNCGEAIDAAQAARLEVAWWQGHRELQRGATGEHQLRELVDTLSALYAFVYSIEEERARPAAEARAEAIAISVRWAASGGDRASPLLSEEGALLVRSYALLLDAVHR